MNENFLLADQAFRPDLFRQRALAFQVKVQHSFRFGEEWIRWISLQQLPKPDVHGGCGERTKKRMKVHSLTYSLGFKSHAEFKFIYIWWCIQRLDRKEYATHAFPI